MVNNGIVSYCDNCLVETPPYELAYLDLKGHRDTRGVFAPRWVQACSPCVPTLKARGYGAFEVES